MMSEWIDIKNKPINYHYEWEIGEKSLAIDLKSIEPYAFEIEWDGDCWCSIGGEPVTHWHPLPELPKQITTAA